MIYTLTLNPAIDLYINTKTKKYYWLAGGKGVNVSKVLKALGVESVCLGFIGGHTGDLIVKDLANSHIVFDFVKTRNPTRVNMKITCEKQVEINAKSNPIFKKEYLALKRKLLKLTSKDILIVSGSLPQDLNTKEALIVIELLSKKKVKMIFDTSSKKIMDVCKFNPVLLKPNKQELANLFNKKGIDNKQIVYYARKLIKLGAQNIIVSLGKDGAFFVNKKVCLFSKAPTGKLVSAVGSGDSMVAGFIHKYLQNDEPKNILKYSIACGSATAFSKGLATKNKINILYKKQK